MAALISIISLLAAIMQIILFFKVWRMCNDIRAMRQQTAPLPEKVDDGTNIIYIIIAVIVVVFLVVMAAVWLS